MENTSTSEQEDKTPQQRFDDVMRAVLKASPEDVKKRLAAAKEERQAAKKKSAKG